jgi:hypothetical protein
MSRTVQATFDVYCELPVEPEPVETGGLKRQFREMCTEMLTPIPSPEQFRNKWCPVQDAVAHALPGPPVKSGQALANYDRLVAEGRSTERRHHQKTKADACDGICSIRCLELALRERIKTK